MKELKNMLDRIALILVIIGGINWLIVGIFRFNVVDWAFAFAPWIASIIYILVGLAAIYLICWLAVGSENRRKNNRQMA